MLEIMMHRKYSNFKSVKQEKSFMLFVIPFYLCVYLSPLEYILLKPEFVMIRIVAGYCIFYIAIITRFISFKTIGNNFSVAIEVKGDSNLVVNGIYKYIRHPMYASLIAFGFGAMLKDPGGIQVLIGAINLIAVYITARVEEKEMITKFGEEYKSYMNKTTMFIPFIL